MPITVPASGVRAGTVAHFAANTPPAGWLACNGAAVSRTLYGALFLAIGTTYGVGDGSTTFNLPDLRGEFIRGHDGGRGVDTGRGMGTAQGFQNASHTHGVTDPGHVHGQVTISNGGSATMRNSDNGATASGAQHTQGANTLTSSAGISINASGGNETRPRNVAMLPCIRF